MALVRTEGLGKRSLIIDDDERICQRVARILRHAGMECAFALNAADGLRAIENDSFDVILLDWTLPDHPGPVVLSRLRARGITVPVLMVTGREAVDDKVSALDAGADDYLVKPFDDKELAARIRALLRRAGAVGGRIEVGAIWVDAANQYASARGAPLDLTPTEYRLLLLLARRAETIVSREELEQFAWQMKGLRVESGTLRVHLAHLRTKLGEAGVQLETVLGRGYRLNRS
jgi:DNA-binding response OmpR family regulator